MYKLYAENEKGERLMLSGNPNYKIKSIDGLTPPNAVINTAVVSTNDGTVFNSSRVGERSINIVIAPQGDIEANRIKLYKIFKVKKPVKLYFSNGSRKVYINGYVESFDGSLFSKLQLLTISVLCPDPYFKDQNGVVVDISQVLNAFKFPFAIEKEGVPFSIVDKTFTKNIINKGDVESGMIIELIANDEVINPIIYNVETRGSFGLNFTMQLGDVIRINTNKNQKSVKLIRYGEERNIINLVKPNPTWFQLEIGDNIFTYSADNGNEFLNLKFHHVYQYEGV